MYFFENFFLVSANIWKKVGISKFSIKFFSFIFDLGGFYDGGGITIHHLEINAPVALN